ncbi:MAG: methionyl-tRNA formyltransferase [Candidatus Wildermuthbacteria bacterium]|nr:methionyl-tRNA formyltransferase [Candidatus Wildermuthbacteria bacterium]
MNIAFFGREFGQILREKLEKAGFSIVNPESHKVDLIVVGFYGKILPKKVLEIPRYGALNVHPSLLPKYRGPTPVQTTILNGETETGVTIILMDEKMDHGPIVARESFKIGDKRFTTPELTKELWELGGDLLVKIIPQWIAGSITSVPQDHAKATYTKLLKKEDGRIDWNKPAQEIERQIRAFTPWPGTFSLFGERSLKILKASVLPESVAKLPPRVAFLTEDKKLAIQCGEDALVIEELQLEGKKPMSAKDFLLGHKDILGSKLNFV